jgi:hypothetical protein
MAPRPAWVAGLVGLRELLGVAAIGLHLVAGLLGNERRRDDLAVDAQVGQLPVECIPSWAGFVADLEILAASELFDELAHRLRTVWEPPEGTNAPALFGDGGGDGFSVNIQDQISSTIAHDRLLPCGSASCVPYQARA